MRGVRRDRGVRSEALKCVAGSGRQEDRRELGRVQRLGTSRHPGSLEKSDVEPHVVAHEARWAVAEREAHEKSDRLLRGGRVKEVVIADTREPQDRRREQAARIREGEESLTEGHGAVGRYGQADRTDLDDRFGLRLVPCGLEVDCDEDPVQSSPI